MPVNKLPQVTKCCGCVTDLKTAVAIIAVLGIVSSPAVSWAVVRHSYVIRVSCYLTTATSRADVVDINLNNVMSFGFGANAGLGPSCLGPIDKNQSKANESPSLVLRARSDPKSSKFVNVVKYAGWAVFFADIILLLCSIHLLTKLSKGNEHAATKRFMFAAALAVTLSFIYGMMYVGACVSIGGSFPIFEFIFSLFDVMLWIYFLIVVNSYRMSNPGPGSSPQGSTGQRA